MDKIILTDFFPLQKELDEEIAKLHNINYENTKSRRLLALLVEFGEFANETRCFKYWSLKGPSEKEKILDEYADGLHFYLSLGIPLGVTELEYDLSYYSGEPTTMILRAYRHAIELDKHYDKKTYLDGFATYLDLMSVFDFSPEEVRNAYLKKMQVNHKRQETKY